MSTPQPRATIADIPPYVAGRPPTVRPGMTSYKLSSNENPYPPLPGVVEAVQAAVGQMNRYPDMGASALYAALADSLDVPVEDLSVATGSVGLIYQLVQAFCDPGDEVVFAWRSFEAYPIAVTAAGAASVRVPVLPDGRHDLDAMAAAITDRTRIVLVCTPNNPTGPAVTQAELDAFLARVPSHVVVVVDEAYVEFVRMDDPVDGLASYRSRANVVLTRTFSKAYGLAGFRVGYAVAPAPIAAALRAVSLPFGVSTVAQVAAIASLERQPELLERVDALVAERTRVVDGLRAAGWDVPDAQGNFVWFGLGERTADFAQAADELGIVVRPFAGEGARVSIGETEANDRLLQLAASFPR
ncbi:histidinol-phosphate transaminase [Nocardioides lianchengensis]|uniref:Aromatic amino acid aminotransferase n=1 Tax=Nocardioides lianchengensis TaxID=1045774 RepID=A0A1G6L0I9_9ACTN|nr:histidinol-phosphate transaminase [Nocardioides lianchengensis]NYG13752.1 histidinol-phosphate aminotransferase [Nocardioides lianchengensis]SDC36235.1 histidinol-phosphate aminotransferase [Nocardioides lianchengensis]